MCGKIANEVLQLNVICYKTMILNEPIFCNKLGHLTPTSPNLACVKQADPTVVLKRAAQGPKWVATLTNLGGNSHRGNIILKKIQRAPSNDK